MRGQGMPGATVRASLLVMLSFASPQSAFVGHVTPYGSTSLSVLSSSKFGNHAATERIFVRHRPAPNALCTKDSTDRHRFQRHGRCRRSRRLRSTSSLNMADTQTGGSFFSGLWAKPSKDEVSVLQLPKLGKDDVAIVWFTASDLRIHDHDALVASAGAAGVIPVYVFDDQELQAESRLEAAFTYHAVRDLRKTLRSVGSDLVLRSGDAAEEVKKIVDEAGVTHVFFHSSPVHALRRSHERVKASLSPLGGDSNSVSQTVDVRSWSATQLTGVEGCDPSAAWNFRDFERRSQGQPARSPFPPPSSLPPLSPEIEVGSFPSLEDVVSRVGSRDEDVQKALSMASRDEPPFGSLALCNDGFGESRALRILDDYLSLSDADFGRSVFGPEEGLGAEVEGMGLESAATRRIVKARGYGGLAPGEVLARALGVALALGCISPRRMFLARQPDYKPFSTAGPQDGNVEPTPRRRRVPRKCWASELAIIESWHSLLAERDVTIGNSQNGPMEQRYLRWHGWLVRYAVGGSGNPADPAVLLVHGFGASSDQWDQVFHEFAPSGQAQLSSDKQGSADTASTSVADAEGVPAAAVGTAKGVRLIALDLVGFGHSAKPPLSFSQYSWADCARDVALRAGGGPFFIAGNSIGGYISMGVAADCKDLCQGVVLVNSAGRVLSDKEFQAEALSKYDGLSVEEATRGGRLGAYSAPPNTALAVLGTGLFAFLQGRIAETCRNVYPVNPGIVDEGLAENILRDSCDPGAIGVIAAGGKLPFSRSANEMLGKFGGPVLVTQGVKDPLNDAEARATSFQALGPQVDVVRIDGGHCPHHEVAEEVCKAVSAFVERVDADRPVAQSA